MSASDLQGAPRSSLCEGWISHRRRGRPGHQFRYRVFMTLLDMDELPRLARTLLLFGHNSPGAVAFSDADHLDVGRDATERGFEVIAVGADYGAGTEVSDVDGAMALLGPVGEGDAVLVKASRVATLELMAEALLA